VVKAKKEGDAGGKSAVGLTNVALVAHADPNITANTIVL